jgi:hypothetical protein
MLPAALGLGQDAIWLKHKIKAAITCQVSSGEKPHYDLGVESDSVRVCMQAFLGMPNQRIFTGFSVLLVTVTAMAISAAARAGWPSYEIEWGAALADGQNPEVINARKKVETARGGLIETRAGYCLGYKSRS